MKRKLEISELIFKILAYTFLTVFALLCLYPFLYAISASISGRHAVEYQELILFPKNVHCWTRFEQLKSAPPCPFDMLFVKAHPEMVWTP